MKLLVLNNISAGHSDGSIFDFVRFFARSGDEIVMRTIDGSCDFAAPLADATRFDCVVASGGDGTIARVCYELRYTGVPILVFPSGTANLISQNILSPVDIPALVDLARTGTTFDFDLGEFDFGSNREGFMMMAGCGFDAQIMSTAEPLKSRLGPVAYLRAAFENATPTVSKISLDVDGEHIETEGVGIIAMNFSKLQFDIGLGRENLPADGQLDVCILATQNAWELLPSAIGIAIDRSGRAFEQSNALKYYRGREIRVETDPALHVEYDGEATSYTSPFTLHVLPSATRLIVTQECIDQFTR